MSIEQKEDLLSMATQLLYQQNKNLEIVRVKVEEFSKGIITELTTEQFYAEINKDLNTILDKIKIYDNIVQEYKDSMN